MMISRRVATSPWIAKSRWIRSLRLSLASCAMRMMPASLTSDPAAMARPGRIVARYHPPGAAASRGDALVHRCAAELQQHPAVRVAFGLPDRAGSATDADDSVAAAGTWHATAAMVGGPQRMGC